MGKNIDWHELFIACIFEALGKSWDIVGVVLVRTKPWGALERESVALFFVGSNAKATTYVDVHVCMCVDLQVVQFNFCVKIIRCVVAAKWKFCLLTVHFKPWSFFPVGRMKKKNWFCPSGGIKTFYQRTMIYEESSSIPWLGQVRQVLYTCASIHTPTAGLFRGRCRSHQDIFKVVFPSVRSFVQLLPQTARQCEYTIEWLTQTNKQDSSGRQPSRSPPPLPQANSVVSWHWPKKVLVCQVPEVMVTPWTPLCWGHGRLGTSFSSLHGTGEQTRHVPLKPERTVSD